MRCLLDTHTLIWWMSGDSNLSSTARTIIKDRNNVSLVSAVSAWEIATKVRLGKLPGAADLIQDFVEDLTRERIEILDVTAHQAIRAGLLPGPRKDPFDRMLIAQAVSQGLPLLTDDSKIKLYPQIKTIW